MKRLINHKQTLCTPYLFKVFVEYSSYFLHTIYLAKHESIHKMAEKVNLEKMLGRGGLSTPIVCLHNSVICGAMLKTSGILSRAHFTDLVT